MIFFSEIVQGLRGEAGLPGASGVKGDKVGPPLLQLKSIIINVTMHIYKSFHKGVTGF